jgi:hypothetical protein
MAGKHAVWRCDFPGCTYESTKRGSFMAHQVLHTGKRK